MFASMGLQTGDDAASSRAAPAEPKEETFLYDLVFAMAKEEPERIATRGAAKTHRDTLNRTQRTKERDLGSLSTTYALTHNGNGQYSKPEFGRNSELQDSFFRKTNLFFPASASAAIMD